MQTEITSPSGGSDDLDLLDADATTAHPATKENSETIPAKYAGKTVEELIQMNEESQRFIGKKSNENGQLRRMADEILNLKKPENRTTEERKPVTVEALLNDPETAIRNAVANSDVGRRAETAEARTAALEATIAKQAFSAKHKGFESDINDPTFIAWVNKNPLRQDLASASAKENFNAAQALWDLWDEHKELVGSKDEPVAPSKKVPATVRSSPVENRGKTIYSRSKLMALRMKVEDGDPAAVARWKDQRFQDNMIQAYAEDRVR